MDHKTAWNLLSEVQARLAGKNGDAFAGDLGIFLKSGLGSLDKVAHKKKKKKQKFVVANYFTKENSEVRIGRVGSNFHNWFAKKIEEAAVLVPQFHHDLERSSLLKEILTDIGGANTAEVTLAGVYELLKLQPNGEVGDLLTEGANTFYVRDADDALRVVSVDLLDDGWFVDAHPVGLICKWITGNRVFSR